MSMALAVHGQPVESNDLIVPQAAAPRIIIPVAGSVQGGNGTFFRSDINIVNYRSVEQRINLYWLPQGSSGSAIAPRTIAIAAASGFASEDFVTNVMLQSGLGAIEIVGVDANGLPDADARLHVSGRIWTPSPDGEPGTFSQTFPAIIPTTGGSVAKAIFGLRRSSAYRLNAGVANFSNSTQRFVITTPQAGNSVTIELSPRSMQQVALPGSDLPAVQLVIQNITSPGTSEWQAWGSSIDNFTGDAWSQVAFPSP